MKHLPFLHPSYLIPHIFKEGKFMSDTTWINEKGLTLEKPRHSAWKFGLVVVVLLTAVSFVLYNAIASGGTQLYLTVNEFYERQEHLSERQLRVSGWVIGESIQYTQIDAQTSKLEFFIVDDLKNPGQTLHVIAMNEPKPDLLQHEAQAMVEGKMGDDGSFHANPGGLLLKCPTRYEDGEPVEFEIINKPMSSGN
jgi:cytochrome c-type biogenesis protein CcmE